jgi:Oxidative-stress-responsive kinase 1 C-terminal domain
LKRELNDIKFEFAVGKDSSEGIASELVSAGLVDSHDMVVIAANLQKLIETTATLGKNVTFPLVSYQMAAAVRTTFDSISMSLFLIIPCTHVCNFSPCVTKPSGMDSSVSLLPM